MCIACIRLVHFRNDRTLRVWDLNLRQRGTLTPKQVEAGFVFALVPARHLCCSPTLAPKTISLLSVDFDYHSVRRPVSMRPDPTEWHIIGGQKMEKKCYFRPPNRLKKESCIACCSSPKHASIPEASSLWIYVDPVCSPPRRTVANVLLLRTVACAVRCRFDRFQRPPMCIVASESRAYIVDSDIVAAAAFLAEWMLCFRRCARAQMSRWSGDSTSTIQGDGQQASLVLDTRLAGQSSHKLDGQEVRPASFKVGHAFA